MNGLTRLLAVAVTAGLAVAGAGSAGATTPPHGKPVIEAAPAHPPKMALVKDSNGTRCTLPTTSNASPSGSSDAPLLWVRAHPTGLVAVWIPGLNATGKHCAARRTTDGAALAQRVAVAIRHTKAFPSEPLPCPYDDNTQVRLYFTYDHGGDEYADVSLAGCRPISAPARASRWSDTAVEKPLHDAAPAAWRSYLAT
ncbi:MAG TPA: hypothetical protein VG650_00275 [Mycobacteriales bacterium]|nr:hypothetical protein [Mycobacteriales bacterium]